MKKLLPLVFITLFSVFSGYAQTPQEQAYIDSLRNRLSITGADSSKLELYITIFSAYLNANPLAGLEYEKEAVALTDRLNRPRQTARLNTILGRLHWRNGNFEEALKYHFDALKIYNDLDDEENIYSLTTCLGQDYADQGNYSEAIRYFNINLKRAKTKKDNSKIAECYMFLSFVYSTLGNYAQSAKLNYEALKIFETTGDKYAFAITTSNLANDYVQMGKYDDALKYYQQAVEQVKLSQDMINLASMYTGMGDIYMLKGDLENAKKNYSTALEIGKTSNNPYNIGQAYEAIGKIYFVQGDLTATLDSYLAAEEMYSSVSNKFEQAAICNAIGNLYMRLNELAKAKSYFDKAFALGEETDNLKILTNYYNGIQTLDSLHENWKSAYFNYRKYINGRDSLNSEENTNASMQTVMQYEFDKKEAATKAEQEKKDISQRNFRNMVIGGAISLFILLIVVYNRYRFKQKANKTLHIAYENLKAAQQQLIEAERKATFGEMATRMAHEIQNPLNFVNNFSSITSELVEEIENERDETVRKETMNMLKLNLQKITENGKRASSIVKKLQDYTNKGTIVEFFDEGKFSTS